MSITIKGYARHRKAAGLPGGTPKAVREAIHAGRLAGAMTKAGRIKSVKLADAAWAATTLEDRVPILGPTAAPAMTLAPSPLQELRMRREAITLELAEADLRRQRGELVPLKDIEAAWLLVIKTSRDALLGLSSKIMARLPSDVRRTAGRIVDEEVRRVLEDLADGGARS